jgi:2'-hydroxyisoflavone reductase
MRTLDRRQFLHTAGAAAAGLSLASSRPSRATPAAPKKVLVIGGTNFLGPAIVESAQRRGLQLTLFNRGKTNPQLFPEVEKLHGDRNADLPTLKAVFAGRHFDAVIDTSGYFPRQVRTLAAALAGQVSQYVFISSVSAYKDMAKPLTEDSPLATLSDPTIEKVSDGSYGGLKVLCEQAAQAALPQGALIIRPGYIIGPRDGSDRFTSWPLRMRRGGPMLAPGSAADPVQVIDVRDLAEWLVGMVERKKSGVYNAVGPQQRLTIGELLATCQSVTKSSAQLIWVAAPLLEQAGVIDKVPIWVPPSEIGMAQTSHARALAEGLRFRPLATTTADTLAWWQTLPAERQAKVRAGLSAEQEAAALKLAVKT